MENSKKYIVTGGAGFIGGALIRWLLKNSSSHIFNFDKISYSSDLTGINKIESSKKRHFHKKVDLLDKNSVKELINVIKPDFIIHLAAETHVDRSIEDPSKFIQSNIIGTFNLLEGAREYWNNLSLEKKNLFRFYHVSTDEVFGTLKENQFFDESSNYSPKSPYSASKASSDHLVNSWHNTFELPTLISNCSNNFGPYQFPEKLIPLTIIKAFNEENIPLYGNGRNVRDWLYVDDHVEGIIEILKKGKVGESYCIGGNNPLKNIEVVDKICSIMDKLNPKSFLHKNLITFVKDRPGHDERYAIDTSFIEEKISWKPKNNFDSRLEETISWYLRNLDWCKKVMNQANYYGNRLGFKI